MIRRVLLAAGGLLALFHAWLFAGQAWNGQLTDPALVFRWLIAGGLVAALIALRRQGVSIFRGRKAVAIWVLAALLHGPAVAHRLDTIAEPALPDFIATLTQIVVASGVMLTAAWALGRMGRRRNVVTRIGPVSSAPQPQLRPVALGGFVRFSPRPPPLTL
jgi:hypothetical protein